MNYEALDEALEYIEAVDEGVSFKSLTSEDKKFVNDMTDFIYKLEEELEELNKGHAVKISIPWPKKDKDKIKKKILGRFNWYRNHSFDIGKTPLAYRALIREFAKSKTIVAFCNKYGYRSIITKNSVNLIPVINVLSLKRAK